MKWILDDGPFGTLVFTLSPVDLSKWPDAELFVADATAAAASSDYSGRRQAALDVTSKSTGVHVITVFDVLVDSPAGSILYGHLRKGTGGSANLAEHQSIAGLLTHDDERSALVTQDKHAAFLALAELGRSRVCHPFELWNHFWTEGRLEEAQYRDLMDRTTRMDRSLPGVPWRFLPPP